METPGFKFDPNPQQPTNVDNIRLVVGGTSNLGFIVDTSRLEALEKENELLRKRIDRLYSHIGLRG